MKGTPIITLLTDFGTRDWFVGTMKGVIARINPRALVVDITHEIEPGNIRAGGFALAASYNYFPKETIHVVVVDPGVGSSRKGIVAQTERFFFIGPDNGVLSWALKKEKIKSIHVLENAQFFLQPLSQTFHGRDLFSPAAAHLGRGTPIRRFGRRLEQFTQLPWPEPRPTRTGWEGEVVYVDRFGNAITNLEPSRLRGMTEPQRWSVRTRNCRCQIGGFYQAVAPGHAVAVMGSSGFLEIAVNGGSAAKRFNLRSGTVVRLSKTQEKSPSHS